MRNFKKIFCIITFVVIFSMVGIFALASENNYHDNCVASS
jgi:hypothetical protein